MKKFLITVIGATGSGKTGFALELAKHLPIEIINADIGQMYQPFTIGVAQPTQAEKSVCSHHLFEFLTTPANFSVADYRSIAQCLCSDIWQRGSIPVFVGGSTLYQHALFFETRSHVPSLGTDSDNSGFLSQFSNEDLWGILKRVDPERAQALHPNDSYRLRRALDIWLATGCKPSFFAPQFAPLAPQGAAVFLQWPREVLYERINQRTEEMLRLGWVNEVKNLSPEWQCFAKEKGLIGYAELVLDLADAREVSPVTIELIKQQTRNYAKRQQTFFKKLHRELLGYSWPQACICDLTLSSLNLYINQIKSMHQSLD